jgi:hypothetical protein
MIMEWISDMFRLLYQAIFRMQLKRDFDIQSAISTSQGYIHKHENLKRKTCNCNANICWSKMKHVANTF